MSPDDLTVSGGVRAVGGPTLSMTAVSMTVVDAVTTGRPPASVVTLRVRNDGPVAARMRLFAVDDWSSAGPVPTEPEHLHLSPGREREILLSTGRPWTRPFSRHRVGAVTVYADLDGEVLAGPRYGVRPVLGRFTVLAAAAVLLAGLGAAILRPADGTGVHYRLAVPTAPAEETGPPPAEPTGRPTDVVYDAPRAATRTPVLVDREGAATPLPPGGPVSAAVKVPSGWVVKRGNVLYLRGGDVFDLGPGEFWVDGTGTQVLVDSRPPGTAGGVAVRSLPDATRASAADLPAHVRIVNWDAVTALVSVRDDGGHWRYDRWMPGRPYLQTPSPFEGTYLGAANGEVVIHQRDGTLDCILRVPDLFRPVGPALRCGFGVVVDDVALRGRWAAVSPGGRYTAVPGPFGAVYVAPLPAMLSGRAGFEPVTGLPGPVVDLIWRDGVTAAMLAGNDFRHVWTCAGAGLVCRPTPLDVPAGLTPVQLAPRIPA
ncbi:hypothetical protein [Virgisporangium ochraceum]|uniref:Uncharacterized protein n=1 Tax=Virgisporangium ochraceum TaxID=65505 RepID=A0A8J4E9P9_9ACTN|nr:hypothetical protein [Virgisporangium ochraceum]GIJ66669.1 hypothetical protein Voc01_015860 [Virgisporangium ochraceum]